MANFSILTPYLSANCYARILGLPIDWHLHTLPSISSCASIHNCNHIYCWSTCYAGTQLNQILLWSRHSFIKHSIPPFIKRRGLNISKCRGDLFFGIRRGLFLLKMPRFLLCRNAQRHISSQTSRVLPLKLQSCMLSSIELPSPNVKTKTWSSLLVEIPYLFLNTNGAFTLNVLRLFPFLPPRLVCFVTYLSPQQEWFTL